MSRRDIKWAKARPEYPSINESYVESVIDSTREAKRGRTERVVTIETFEDTFMRSRPSRVNWRGNAFLLERADMAREAMGGPITAASKSSYGYVKFELTLIGYREDRRPFDYWNAALTNSANPALIRAVGGYS